jgi:hypothetical protein
MRRLVFLFLRMQLFAASSSAVIALAATPSAVYEIPASLRGTALINAFNGIPLLTPPVVPTELAPSGSFPNSTWYPEALIQTTLPATLGSIYASYSGVLNGRIPWVQNIFPTMFNTLSIVEYLPTNFPGNPQYIVLPTEQLVDLLYFPNPNYQPKSNAAFTATAPPNTLPFFSVDPYQRAADIISAWNTLLNNTSVVIANFTSSASQVWIQTTLSGPFAYTPMRPGLLENVTSISMSGTGAILQIMYTPNNRSYFPQIIYVPAEDVEQIIFVRDFNNPRAL